MVSAVCVIYKLIIHSLITKRLSFQKKLKTHNPQSVYQQWEFNDLTQPSQPISRYQEDSPPPSPPSFEDSSLPSPLTESMSPSITKHHHIILSEQLSVEKVPNEPSSEVSDFISAMITQANTELSVEKVSNELSSEVADFIIVEKVPNELSSEVADFIPAMITQANTQEENNDKICIRNIQPKNRTSRMDANIPKLFSTKSVNKKVLKTTKDIRLSQEPSLTKYKQYNKMFRRSNPHNDNKPSLKNEILREVGLIRKKTRPTKDIISRAINKQMSGTRPKKQVRYEEKKESPVVRRREYKAIPLQILLTKQTITLPQTQSKVQQQRQSKVQQHRQSQAQQQRLSKVQQHIQSKVQQQKQSKVQQHNIRPLKKLPPLRRRPIITNKSFSKSKTPSKSTKPKSVVSKLQKEVVYCADSEDEFKNLTG